MTTVKSRRHEHHDRASELPAPASTRQSSGGNSPAASPSPAADSWADLDVLSDVLRTVRLTGAVFFPLEATSPWVDEVPAAAEFASIVLPGAQHVVSYHIVRRGRCWATVSGVAPVRLETGDILVIPHGDRYSMSSAPDMRSTAPSDAVLMFFRHMAGPFAPAVVIEGGGGNEGADLVCGFLGCDTRPFNPVLEALPRMLHLPRDPAGRTGDRLTDLIEFAVAESRERRSGARCVLLHLSELLFVEVVRRHLDSLPSDHTGWLAGLRDPIAGHALALLHNRPAEPWTLNQLAREIGVSRSTLAGRFSELIGQPPMRYLTRWRIQLACRLLCDGTAKVSAVALDVGYRSEAAFSRAFKESVGVSPAIWRRSAGSPALAAGARSL
jgi:AraC-like DNA-binding protein